MTIRQTEHDVEVVLDAARPLARPRARPALVVLVGPPGSGKSAVAEALDERSPLVVLCSDDIRNVLVEQPDHSFAETQRVTRAIRSAAAELLSQQITVVLDSANLTERERSPLYRLAEQQQARLIVLEVTAPIDAVLQRLRDRHELPGAQEPPDLAADVYHRMAGRSEPISRDHVTVDTSQEFEQFIDALALDLDEG